MLTECDMSSESEEDPSVALDSPKLRDLLKNVASGKIQLPDFQREWKWDDERIRALIATVTLNYPLGANRESSLPCVPRVLWCCR